MKCPYTVNTQQFNEHKYTYNEDGQVTKETNKLIETHPFVDCIKEECAAWNDGCQYRGAVN